MKKRVIKLLQPLLHRCDLHLLRTKDYDSLCTRETILRELVNTSQQASTPAKKLQPEFVIFSKDRALQLHGLLCSLFHQVKGDYKLNVLYYASSEAHREAYLEVQQAFKDRAAINWVSEQNFREDLIHTLNQVDRPEVCFLVDDIVFTRPIDLNSLDWSRYSAGIFSLRLGRNISHCYTKDRAMTAPQLSRSSDIDDVLGFSWQEGTLDWAYPLSVDGHIFPTRDIQVAVSTLNFKAPNTFERALQILHPLYSQRKGYCFTHPRLVNIPLNRVQDESDNISGEITADLLLQKWQEGEALNIEALTGIDTKSVHQEITVSFCQR